MSIATKGGDAGQTSLSGGLRVSKSDQRVEAYGTVDELNSSLGFARSICSDELIRKQTEEIQRTLFRVGSILATPEDSKRKPEPISEQDVESLTVQVYEIEKMEGILSDWSLPGAHTESAAYEVARTVCRRAERLVVRFHEAGGAVDANLLAYLNRLSDLIWLFGRKIEVDAGINSLLRDPSKPGNRWSRAWK